MNANDKRQKFSLALGATPLSEEGKDCLGKLGHNLNTEGLKKLRKMFFNDIYIPPFKSSYASKLGDDDCEFDDIEEIAAIFGRERDQLDERIRLKESFESRLLAGAENFFIITASAGSGKTTYVNWLYDELIQKQIDGRFVLVDIENRDEVRRKTRILDTVYDLGSVFDSSLGRFLAAILHQIHLHLCMNHGEKEEYYKERLKDLCDWYNVYFEEPTKTLSIAEDPQITSLFSELLKYSSTSKITYNALSCTLVEIFKDIVTHKATTKESAVVFFGILLRLLFCSQEHEETFCFVAIDNIERLIEGESNTIIVQEHDLREIIAAVDETVNETNTLMRKANLSFKECFVVLFALRDTSVKFFETIHFSDQNAPLEMSDWFDTQLIYEQKLNNYIPLDEYEEVLNESGCHEFNKIMLDKGSLAGLYHSISNMYNNNKRRIYFILDHILQKDNNAIVAKEVLELWERTFENGVSTTLKSAYRHLYRKAIMRLYYNHFDIKGLYDRLGVGKYNKIGNYASFARRILTYLYCVHPQNKHDDFENYSYLFEIVDKVIKPIDVLDSKDVSMDSYRHLANMLYLMSDINMVPHNWSPLIELIIGENMEFTVQNILTALLNSHQQHSYRIKITDAGRFYAFTNVDFEYFAARYYPDNRLPLVAQANLQPREVDGKITYECLQIIKAVRQNAFKCIEALIKYDLKFFTVTGEAFPCKIMYSENYTYCGKPHPLRIINHHIGYLNAYRVYIEYSELVSADAKKMILDQIDIEKGKYTRKIFELLDKDEENKWGYFKTEHRSGLK